MQEELCDEHDRISTLLEAIGPHLSAPSDLTGFISKQDHFPTAHGGFADIWRCTHDDSKSGCRSVAVKVLRSMGSDTAGDSQKLFKILRRELAVWHDLSHPRILPLLGVVSNFGPYPSMVCPWMDNGNLTQYLKDMDATLTLEDRYRILRQVCEGLTYLHSRSIVHGDLTGSNVLVDAVGDACLSDFGLSGIISDLQGPSTATSSIAGNVRFVAPELLRHDEPQAATVKCDVYSFGSIMLQTLTSNIPYHYLRLDAQVLLEVARDVRPRRPDPSDSIVSDSRWGFICACWSTTPSYRPTMEEVDEFLRNPTARFAKRGAEMLPELWDIELVEVLNASHGLLLEAWTGIHTAETKETVVVKLFRRPSESENRSELLQAVRNLRKVTHPNVLSYLGTTSHLQDCVGVVAPYFESRSLCAVLRSSFVPVFRKFLHLQEIAEGLSYLHSLSVVHGGLTGWNILVGRDGTVKLCNYGLLPILLQHVDFPDLLIPYDEDIRWADPVLWLKPEAGSESPRLATCAHDVFAFGRVMLQLFTGRVPFHYRGKAAFPMDSVTGLTPTDFIPQRPSAKLVSDNMWKLMLDCWADDINARPTIEQVLPRIMPSTTRLPHTRIPSDNVNSESESQP